MTKRDNHCKCNFLNTVAKMSPLTLILNSDYDPVKTNSSTTILHQFYKYGAQPQVNRLSQVLVN